MTRKSATLSPTASFTSWLIFVSLVLFSWSDTDFTIEAKERNQVRTWAQSFWGNLSQCGVFLKNLDRFFDSQGAIDRQLSRHFSARKFRLESSIGMIGIPSENLPLNRHFYASKYFPYFGAVNATNNPRYAVIMGTRQTGLATLVNEVRAAEHMRAMAFVPSQNMWVDITWRTGGYPTRPFAIDVDQFVIDGLIERYGSIEIYTTHPLSLANVARGGLSVEPKIFAALPTSSEINNSLSIVWRNKRSIPISFGVIHELGATLFRPTEFQLRSKAGPSMGEVFSMVDWASLSDLSVNAQIDLLTHKLEEKLRIEDTESPPFRIVFFGTDQLALAAAWPKNSSVSLPEKEANDIMNHWLRR